MVAGKHSRKSAANAAALGLRAHSGWAALVAVAGSPRAPVVLDRRRIEIADPKIRGSKQPFHAAEPLDLGQAEQLIRRCTESTRLLARQALHAGINELREKGYVVRRCGILLGSGRPIPPLATILASHALIHAAEGEFFRNALLDAAEHCGLAVTGVRERELFSRAAAELRISADEWARRTAEIGRLIGPPWRQDEKLAALVGCLALCARTRE